jgi:hypothetical protein
MCPVSDDDESVEVASSALERQLAVFCRPMSEVEFDRMLDAVRTAMALTPERDFFAHPTIVGELPKAANDNLAAWPFIAFPESLHAVSFPGP